MSSLLVDTCNIALADNMILVATIQVVSYLSCLIMRDAHSDHVNAIFDSTQTESELPIVVRRRYILLRRPVP